ncbi:hypothetical protein [Thermodesulfovibrio sp. TK110]
MVKELTKEEQEKLIRMQKDIIRALQMAGASEDVAKEIIKNAKVLTDDNKEVTFQ